MGLQYAEWVYWLLFAVSIVGPIVVAIGGLYICEHISDWNKRKQWKKLQEERRRRDINND